MKLITLLFLLFTFTLNCIALEVILNPYEQINYDELNAYYISESCNCNCDNYQENYYSQTHKDWWQ